MGSTLFFPFAQNDTLSVGGQAPTLQFGEYRAGIYSSHLGYIDCEKIEVTTISVPTW